MTLQPYPFVGFNRWTDRCTFTASSAAAGFAAANLATLPLGIPWQSTDATDQWIKGEFDTDLLVQQFLLSRPDLTDLASLRLRLYSSVAASQNDATNKLYDSQGDVTLIGGQRFWPIVYSDDQIEWEGENWLPGSYTDQEKKDTVFHRPITLNDAVLTRSWRLDLSDVTNPLAFMRLGHIDVAQGWQFSRSFDLKRTSDFELRTTTVTPYGGSDVHNRLSKKRTFTGDMSVLPRNEVQNVIYEMARMYDVDTPFAFTADPTDPASWLRECFLSKFSKLPPQVRAGFAVSGTTLTLKEAF